MSDKSWQEIYDSVKIEGKRNLPLPTDADLDEFEQTTGFKLPVEYREYIKIFGPGELCNSFRIASPGYPKSKYPDEPEHVDLIRMLEWYRDCSQDEVHYSEDPDPIRRLMAFVEEIDGTFWGGWDPEDVRDSASREYGIYFLWDGVEELKPVPVASFREFIENYCIGGGYLESVDDWDESELGPWKTFLPS